MREHPGLRGGSRGWVLGTFAGALGARQISFRDLRAETVGEVEAEGKVLVIRRIKQTFHLSIPEGEREIVGRVLPVYADSCPVARSVKGSIDISSEVDFVPT